MKKTFALNRRRFIQGASAAAFVLPLRGIASAAEGEGPHQATGTRVGEVTESSAIVWTRLTKHSQRNNDGVVFAKKVDKDFRREREKFFAECSTNFCG